jgi:protein-disulfide isomerase
VETGITQEGHPWMGAREPELVVHEFADYACPHCAIASNRSRMKVADNEDMLRVVRRQQPRMRCRAAVPSSCSYVRAAVCAQQQDKFWEMDSWLFAHAAGKAVLDVMPAVDEVGLDAATFETCLTAPETYEAAEALSKPSRKLRIVDTPTYMVEGSDDKLTPQELEQVYDERL